MIKFIIVKQNERDFCVLAVVKARRVDAFIH